MLYDSDDYRVASILMNLGIVHGELGKVAEKGDLCERALKIFEKRYGPNHHEVANTLVNLGTAYGAIGEVHRQLKSYERALKIFKGDYNLDHYKIAGILMNLGNTYGDLGNVCQKRVLCEHALEIFEEHYDPDHYQVAMILMNLGNAYGDLGDVRRKQDLLERALKIDEAHYGPDHYQVAMTLVSLGNACGSLGDAVKQRDLCKRALEIQEAYYGADHYQVGLTLENLGNAYGSLGDVHQQQKLLERALQIEEAHYGPDHSGLVTILANLSFVYVKLAKQSLALQTAQRACSILVNHSVYGIKHPKTREIAQAIQSKCDFSLSELHSSFVSAWNDETATQLYRKAGLCLVQGKVDEAVKLYKSASSRSGDSNILILHHLASAYHIRSRQKRDPNDWLEANRTFKKAIKQIASPANTYVEYAQFLYLKGLEQPEKTLFEQAVTQLLDSLVAEEEGDLLYSGVEQETISPCLCSLLVIPEGTFEVRPKLLARYLLVSCYCHLNQLSEAQIALEALEKAVSTQSTNVTQILLSTAKTECTVLRGTSSLSEEKVGSAAINESKSSAFDKDISLKRERDEGSEEKSSPLTSPASSSLFVSGMQQHNGTSHAVPVLALEIDPADSQMSDPTNVDLSG